MVETHIDDIMHKETSSIVKKLLETVPEAVIQNKLEDRLAEIGINQKQLSLLTGLREGSISDFVNGRKINISKYQLIALMIGLRITDLTDIIDIKFPKETEEQFKIERENWIRGGVDCIPKELETHYIRSLEE
ncbi:TPA: helix-turn-helix transcriptional regulator [Clostridioides difficile]|nr:helix-turn-helix transcriptional regulator [Clostridioides difficile]